MFKHLEEKCTCGSSLILRTNRKDNSKFLGCCNYPDCKKTYSVYPEDLNRPKRKMTEKELLDSLPF